MITQHIKIYMDDRLLPDIRMVAGDIGRQILPIIYANQEADEALDLTNYTLRCIFIKPDNTFVIQDYIDGVIDIPDQAGAVTGSGYYQIRLTRSGEEVYSGQGRFVVDDYILTGEMIESIAEVNGYQFPDDFLTQGDMPDLSDYYTKEETDTAISTAIAGAASYACDMLFDYDGNVYDFWPSGKKNITLLHPYTDYDMIYIVAAPVNYTAYMMHVPVLVAAMISGKKHGALVGVGSNAWGVTAFNVIDSTHLEFEGADSNTRMRLYYIYGLKWSTT